MSRGLQRERDLVRKLREDGWWAIRSPASKGDVDVVAIKRMSDGVPRVWFIEVKSTAAGPYSHFGPSDRAGLVWAALEAGAEAWLAYWPPRKKLQWIPACDWPRYADLGVAA
jgi:Holliday junction resolvase